MPLIIITGYPCSGKTHRARQLVEALQDQIAGAVEPNAQSNPKLALVHIPSHHSSIHQLSTNGDYPNRDSIYSSAALEKTARAAELSAIKRALSKDAIVIADDLNYIKGFRYQLWCEAKAAGTRCCTVHCAAREDQVEKWNRARLEQWAESKSEDIPTADNDTTRSDGHVENHAYPEIRYPESHTALYGDRIPELSSRSRSSSVDADDGERVAFRPSIFIEESLKSFSLADQSSISTGKPSPPGTAADNGFPSHNPEEIPASARFDFVPPSSPPYSQKTLQSLLMRYEPPSPFSRWDMPLFTVLASDLMPPISAIWDAIFPPRTPSTMRKGVVGEQKAQVKPHAATVLPQATGPDALQVLERVTLDVVTQIMMCAKEFPELTDEGGDVTIKCADIVTTLPVPPGTILSLPMLQRLRRRFTQIQRGGIAHGRGGLMHPLQAGLMI
ncbi:hypothetical protein GJ744_008084 [Endocarpon pusillum]|uniref:Uncharacterized protein n=1 Tax=Endocarpon pusillum TaxID=364733 RepID=A0A8H7ALV4_9EURO|nr:hypothetical protein GJ744_008084 [Endocarpon pusillum]